MENITIFLSVFLRNDTLPYILESLRLRVDKKLHKERKNQVPKKYKVFSPGVVINVTQELGWTKL